MGVDYYSALGLTRSASDTDIKKSYRKLALRYHPDINSSEDARSQFLRVCEAYDVLCNSRLKGFYELHGEEALKHGKPDGNGGTKGAIYSFSESDCTRVFARFFGTSNPYEALEDLTSTFEAMTATHQPKAGKPQQHSVELTLEELFHGCLKKVTFQRQRVTSEDETTLEDRVLTIDIKPGLPEGTRFVFEGEGNIVPGTTPGQVVFVLKTLPHNRFARRGADLIYKPRIPLYHALAGAAVQVKLLDNRMVDAPVAEVITPGYSCSLPNLGLPDPKRGPTARGNLVIEAELLFPKSLSQAQKLLLKAVFFLPKEKEQCEVVKNFVRGFEDPLTGWHAGVLDA